MGILFDARGFNSRKSNIGELGNFNEILRIRNIVMDSLADNPFDYTFKVKKKSITIKGKKLRLQDPYFESINIKGDFGSLDLSDKKTWKSSSIDSIAYRGEDGKIKINELDDSGSLGSLQSWDRIPDPKFGEKMFSGDDIIYSTKKHRTDHGIWGGSGNDQIIVYGGENVEGGKGKDQFFVTKDAVEYLSNKRALDIKIEDAMFFEGDSVLIEGKESVFTLINDRRKFIQYDSGVGRISIFRDDASLLPEFL